MEGLYEPGEDTFLLASVLPNYRLGRVLEIGTGTGYITAAAAKKAKHILAVDVDSKAVKYCREHHKLDHVTFRQSDLFSRVSGRYDTIIFNPPYLPYDKREPKQSQLVTMGGKHGYELLTKFIAKSPSFLTAHGRILIVFSSLTNKQKVDEAIISTMLEKKQVVSRKIPFEELFVYCIRKSSLRQQLEKGGMKELFFFAKGKRGFVFTGLLRKKKVAVKVHNPQSPVLNALAREARMLRFANRLGIGPRLIASGREYVIYQFVEGEQISSKVASLSRNQLRLLIKRIGKQLFVLDKAGIAKEEMSNPYKHIIITSQLKPVLIDFERARKTKTPHNVTQFCSYLLHLQAQVKKRGIHFSRKDVIDWAKHYALLSPSKREQHLNKLMHILF